MNEIEKGINDAINGMGKSGMSAGKNSFETLKYTLKYFREFQHLSKKELRKRIAVISFVCVLMAVTWFSAPELARLLIEKYKSSQLYQTPFLTKLIQNENTYRLIGLILIPYIYLMMIGSKKIEECRQFTEQFELIGMIKQLNKFVVDEFGNKKRLTVTPELIACYKPSADITIRMFSTNGQPLQVWEAKRSEIEAAFNEQLYQLTNSEKSLNVVKMVTVSQAYKEELEQKYLKEQEYDAVFEKIGLVGKGTREINHFGKKMSIKNFPQYLSSELQVINSKKVEILEFRSTGTEYANWISVKFLMENVLNKLVVKIEQGKKDKQIYKVYTMDLIDDLAEAYDWKDEHIEEEEGVLVLGEGLLGKVTLDLNSLPHVLIGGVTNFGKSVLSNCITWQLIKKGALVIPIDFKGGIELDMFSPFHEVVFERGRAIEVLDEVIKEYEERLKLIKSRKLKKITQFNKKYPEEALCRMIIVIDEIAEMLTGASTKVEANQIAVLDNQISTIARLARAVGIHLILGTQRPDANVLQGQIKNNLPARICGRMIDKEPSMMILGTPDATRIPDIKGRFMFSLGAEVEIFQAYYFKDSDIVPGNYIDGQCLVYDMPCEPMKRPVSKITKPKQRLTYDADDFESIKDPTEALAVDDDWLVDQIGAQEVDEEDLDEEDIDEEDEADEEVEADFDEDQEVDERSDSAEQNATKKRRIEII